ncbi:MAG: hypothetical protein JW993_07025 [Sedimentisphaerales bacterium]|nr:hypothetical protein [Sedimentisphaerales bacterium]
MSKADVLKAFLAREARGLPLNHAAVLRDDRRLHAAALRIFGQWDHAMQACGITPSRVRCHRRWSRQRVIERIAELASLGRPLNVRAIQVSEATLASAADRYFDSWADALAAAGVDPSLWMLRVPTWTPQRVVQAIQRLQRDGTRLNHAALARNSLSQAAVKIFGSWDAALREAGIDPETVRVYRKPWTAEELIAELRRKHECDEPLNARDVRPNHIRRPACRLFGSWDAALAAAGLDPATIRGNTRRG